LKLLILKIILLHERNLGWLQTRRPPFTVHSQLPRRITEHVFILFIVFYFHLLFLYMRIKINKSNKSSIDSLCSPFGDL